MQHIHNEHCYHYQPSVFPAIGQMERKLCCRIWLTDQTLGEQSQETSTENHANMQYQHAVPICSTNMQYQHAVASMPVC